jgi:hypothetical protein
MTEYNHSPSFLTFEQHLDKAAEHLMIAMPDTNITFLNIGHSFMGRRGLGRSRELEIETENLAKRQWPETGLMPFGHWLMMFWGTKIPRLLFLPFHANVIQTIDLVLYGIREPWRQNYRDRFVRKTLIHQIWRKKD